MSQDDLDDAARFDADEHAWVRDVLQPLADVPMPDEVASRIDQALREEAPAHVQRAEAATLEAEYDEQPPSIDADAASARRRQRGAVGALAVFVVLLIAAIAVSQHAKSPTTSSASSGGNEVITGTTSITDSGRSWSPEDLQSTLRLTLSGAHGPQVAQRESTAAPSSPKSGDAGAALAAPQSSVAGGTVSAPSGTKVEALVSDPAARAGCIAGLGEASNAVPIAVDAGTFNGSPAVAILFPSTSLTNHVDIYVVGPNCSTGDPNVLLFDRLPRP